MVEGIFPWDRPTVDQRSRRLLVILLEEPRLGQGTGVFGLRETIPHSVGHDVVAHTTANGAGYMVKGRHAGRIGKPVGET